MNLETIELDTGRGASLTRLCRTWGETGLQVSDLHLSWRQPHPTLYDDPWPSL